MSESQPQSTPPPAAGAAQPTLTVEKVFVKDLSLEIPHAPQIFAEQVQPQIEVQISTQSAKLTESHFEVQVTATVTARAGERTVFLVEVVQAAIFHVTNIPPRDLEPFLAIGCPAIIFPYLRETISDVISRGGFPPVLLAHFSFDGLYLQRLQDQQVAAAAKEPAR